MTMDRGNVYDVDAGFDDDGLEEMMSFVCGSLKRLKLLLVGRSLKEDVRNLKRMKRQR